MTMSPTARRPIPPLDPETLHGFHLYDNSRDLGELEEVVVVGGHHYHVVDARHWSYGTRKLLPVAAVASVDLRARRVFIDVDPDQLRASPDFDPFLLSTDHYAERVESYFSESFGPPRSDAD